MNWFQDGDRNTKFFHAQVNGIRKRLQLNRIQNNMGQQLEGNEAMAEEAVNFLQAQFHEETIPMAFDILDHVPRLVEDGQNHDLIGLNGNSAGGPDGFNGSFFQVCWRLLEMVSLIW